MEDRLAAMESRLTATIESRLTATIESRLTAIMDSRLTAIMESMAAGFAALSPQLASMRDQLAQNTNTQSLLQQQVAALAEAKADSLDLQQAATAHADLAQRVATLAAAGTQPQLEHQVANVSAALSAIAERLHDDSTTGTPQHVQDKLALLPVPPRLKPKAWSTQPPPPPRQFDAPLGTEGPTHQQPAFGPAALGLEGGSRRGPHQQPPPAPDQLAGSRAFHYDQHPSSYGGASGSLTPPNRFLHTLTPDKKTRLIADYAKQTRTFTGVAPDDDALAWKRSLEVTIRTAEDDHQDPMPDAMKCMLLRATLKDDALDAYNNWRLVRQDTPTFDQSLGFLMKTYGAQLKTSTYYDNFTHIQIKDKEALPAFLRRFSDALMRAQEVSGPDSFSQSAQFEIFLSALRPAKKLFSQASDWKASLPRTGEDKTVDNLFQWLTQTAAGQARARPASTGPTAMDLGRVDARLGASSSSEDEGHTGPAASSLHAVRAQPEWRQNRWNREAHTGYQHRGRGDSGNGAGRPSPYPPRPASRSPPCPTRRPDSRSPPRPAGRSPSRRRSIPEDFDPRTQEGWPRDFDPGTASLQRRMEDERCLLCGDYMEDHPGRTWRDCPWMEGKPSPSGIPSKLRRAPPDRRSSSPPRGQ